MYIGTAMSKNKFPNPVDRNFVNQNKFEARYQFFNKTKILQYMQQS